MIKLQSTKTKQHVMLEVLILLALNFGLQILLGIGFYSIFSNLLISVLGTSIVLFILFIKGKLPLQNMFEFKSIDLNIFLFTPVLAIFTICINEVFYPFSSGLTNISEIFIGLLIIPLIEEIFFRGVIFKKLNERFSLRFSIILSSLFFSFFYGVHGIFMFFGGIGFYLAFLSRNGDSLINTFLSRYLYNGIIFLNIFLTSRSNQTTSVIYKTIMTPFKGEVKYNLGLSIAMSVIIFFYINIMRKIFTKKNHSFNQTNI